MEKWRPVLGYEGWYEVSSLGKVRRVKLARHTHKSASMRVQIYRGYHYIELCKNGIQKKLLLSRVVCAAFHGPCPVGKNCNHKNGDKACNSATNLEWITHSENCAHKYRVLGHSMAEVIAKRWKR